MKNIASIGTGILLSLVGSSFGAGLFVEASTDLQKVGWDAGAFRPFLAGNFSYIASSDDDNSAVFTLGAGADLVKEYNEVECGLRLVGDQTMEIPDNPYVAQITRGALELIASKSFGPLSLGAGLGPSVASVSGLYRDYKVIALNSELFGRYNF